MAGDYLQIDHDLPDKVEFLAIVEATGETVETVFYRLFCLWRLVDRQTLDGVLRKCGPAVLAARCGGTAEFWKTVAEVTKSEECPDGWLEFRDGNTIIPKFAKRFANCAKRRIADAQRKRREMEMRRARGRSCGGDAEDSAEDSADVTRSNCGGICGDDAEALAGARAPETRDQRPKTKDQRSQSSRDQNPDPKRGSSETPQAATSEPALLLFPTVGNGPKHWGITSSFVDELSAGFPNVDVLSECRKALTKINAGAVTKKTARGMPKFLAAWMDRAQNSSRSDRPAANSDPRGNMALINRMMQEVGDGS